MKHEADCKTFSQLGFYSTNPPERRAQSRTCIRYVLSRITMISEPLLGLKKGRKPDMGVKSCMQRMADSFVGKEEEEKARSYSPA